MEVNGDIKRLIDKGKVFGLTQVVPLSAANLEVMEDVRQMCAANTCGKYAANWSCPPGCGELDAIRKKLETYREGLLVQTVGDVEDSFDFENMMRTEQAHKEHFIRFYDYLKETYDRTLALGSGSCTRCASCTYPDAPCRMPHQMVSSMEAYGLLVSDVCRKSDLPYYYGSDKIAFTSCYLLR